MAREQDTSRCAVTLRWELDGDNGGTYATTSGFVCHKFALGIYIVSTAHQLKHFKEDDDTHFVVTATFFDGTIASGSIDIKDENADLTLALFFIDIGGDDPLAQTVNRITAPSFSRDPLYPRQPIYSIHSPCMTLAVGISPPLVSQHSVGFVADPNYSSPFTLNEPIKFHYHLPLMMAGSSGAPVFDLATHRVVGIHCGIDSGAMGTIATFRQYGILAADVLTFLARSFVFPP